MKDLEVLCDRAIDIVKKSCGNVVECIHRPLTINREFTDTYGYCRKLSFGDSRIEISGRLLEADVQEDAIMSVVIHEVLHACKDGQGHEGKWKNYAKMVNRKFPQYHISENSLSFFGITPEQLNRYVVECPQCGDRWYDNTLTKMVVTPTIYKCARCNVPLRRVK